MYNPFELSLKYVRYLLRASNGRGHGIHSPFVFDFITNVLNDRAWHDAFDRIEGYRKELLADRRVLRVEDFGAGSAFGDQKEKRICDIARRASKPPKLGRLLYRISSYYGCRNVLELGTSLGISTAYLAAPPSVENLITMEGAKAVAGRAVDGLASLGLAKVRLLEGNFDDTLAIALGLMPSPDLVFLDGNHREEPTIRYFRQCLEAASDDSIFIFDDIHWSREMESAWEQIKLHPEVRCTIDLFFIGIVLFRKSFLEKQHFVIRHQFG